MSLHRSSAIIKYFLALILSVSQASKVLHYSRDVHLIEHAVDLDTITFDKVVSNQNVTVVLFMHYLASGVVNTEFKNFAESTGTQPEVIAATVPLLDGGHQENWEIAQRFNLSMDRLPVIKVFVRGKEVAHMEEVTNCDDIRQLVREHTGLWIGRPGTLQYLDELVNEFMKTGQEKRREEIIELARQFRDDESISDEHFKSATYYVRIFEEFMKQGPAFIGMEDGRVKVLRARHKTHKENHCGILKQLNILRTFQQLKVHMPHDEL